MEAFNKMNNDLLQSVLDNYLHPEIGEKRAIELYLTNTCNLKCSYCYLWHNKELYPESLANANDIIVKNTGIFIDYLIKNNVTAELNIFSGEFFMLPYWKEILDLLYNKYKSVSVKPNLIVIPTNMSFLFNDKTTQEVENYIDLFNSIQMKLHLSMSVDGKYAQDVRFGKPVEDEFYDKVFTFKKKYNCGFHPMVSKETIKNWKQNLDWIVEMYKKFDIPEKHMVALEVRNDYWTEEDIKDYLDFLGYVMELNFKLVNGDKSRFINTILFPSGIPDKDAVYGINFLRNILNTKQSITCGMQHRLHVRMGDLSIGACHRLFYDKFKYGEFVVENDEIIGLNATNVAAAMTFTYMKGINLPKCSKCPYRYICLKGCLGAQYEANGDPLMPCKSVCDLMKSKFNFIIAKLKEMDVYEQMLRDYPIVEKRLRQLELELVQNENYNYRQ